jgi:RNA polymerase sigma-70 factor (ECF subfamily)
MVVILHYQEDLDPVEIAEELDMPLGTVRSHLRRSIGILRQKMARAGGGARI